MPELPDLTIYAEALDRFVVGTTLDDIRLASPFLLRTADPPLAALRGRTLLRVRRIGKHLVLAFEGDLFMVIHLMIAGRFHWKPRGAVVPRKVGLAAFDFPGGTVLLTEASTKQRAALYVVRGEEEFRRFDQGGVEPLQADLASFRDALVRENHTLKRALTDPHLFSGIGNAYSDEILHRAQLSPVAMTRSLSNEQVQRLHDATRAVLLEWVARLRQETGQAFPERVTAFRKEMAVHGRYRQPCPVCGTPIQRIVYAENEANYCPRCQTGGRLLADRSLSRLLGANWPRTLEELEQARERHRGPQARSVVAKGTSTTPDARSRRRR
jgi:formamidopyrimidine-DNA glycosylase